MRDQATEVLRQDTIRVITNGYLGGADWLGLEDIRAYLSTKGIHLRISDQVLGTWDDEARKQFEKAGQTVVNPTVRNGWRRTITATDLEKADSLITRVRTTRTRSYRDDQQHKNLADKATDPVVRQFAEYQSARAEARKHDEAADQIFEKMVRDLVDHQT